MLSKAAANEVGLAGFLSSRIYMGPKRFWLAKMRLQVRWVGDGYRIVVEERTTATYSFI